MTKVDINELPMAQREAAADKLVEIAKAAPAGDNTKLARKLGTKLGILYISVQKKNEVSAAISAALNR